MKRPLGFDLSVFLCLVLYKGDLWWRETRSGVCRTGRTRWFWYVLGAMKLGVVVVTPMARRHTPGTRGPLRGVRGKPWKPTSAHLGPPNCGGSLKTLTLTPPFWAFGLISLRLVVWVACSVPKWPCTAWLSLSLWALRHSWKAFSRDTLFLNYELQWIYLSESKGELCTPGVPRLGIC